MKISRGSDSRAFYETLNGYRDSSTVVRAKIGEATLRFSAE